MRTNLLCFAFVLCAFIAQAQSTNSNSFQENRNAEVADSIPVFKSGSYAVSQYQLKGEEVQVLDIQRDKGYYSILQINSPEKTPFESTITLMNESDAMGVEFLDLYNQNYSSETQFGIRLQKRGKGKFKPFVLDFSDGKTKTKVFQATSDQQSTFYGKLNVAGNFLSVQGKGSGYSFSALELKSDEPTPKLWQISHKQDIPHALTFSYHDGNGWMFPLMISEKGNTLVGSIEDKNNGRFQVDGASYFKGDMVLDQSKLALRGNTNQIDFGSEQRQRGRIISSEEYLGFENTVGNNSLKLLDSGSVRLSGMMGLTLESEEALSSIHFRGKGKKKGLLAFDTTHGNLFFEIPSEGRKQEQAASLLISGKNGDVYIGANPSHKKLQATGRLHASDVLVNSASLLEGRSSKELKELKKRAEVEDSEVSLLLVNQLLLDKVEELYRKLDELENRIKELEK